MSASVCLSRTLRSPSLFCVAPVCMIYIVRFEAIEQEGFRATKCLRVCFCHTYLRKAARSLIYPTSVIVASTPHTIHTHTHTLPPSLSLFALSLSLFVHLLQGHSTNTMILLPIYSLAVSWGHAFSSAFFILISILVLRSIADDSSGLIFC